MSAYLNSLKPTQRANAEILIQRMKANGITNENTISAILSVISKESEFIPQFENLNYSEASIRRVFKKVPESIVPQLARNPQALGNYVYGPSYNPDLGNGVNEGFKYRGGGYNQITGKANYNKIGNQIGVNLVANPELINTPQVAADAAIQFFKNGVETMKHVNKLKDYNALHINDFKTPQDSLGAMYHINAGVGSTKAKLDADVTGGKAKAESRLSDLLSFVKSGASQAIESAKQNPITSALVTSGLIILSYFFFKYITSKK